MNFIKGLWAMLAVLFVEEPIWAWIAVAAVVLALLLAPLGTVITLALVVLGLWLFSWAFGLDWEAPEPQASDED